MKFNNEDPNNTRREFLKKAALISLGTFLQIPTLPTLPGPEENKNKIEGKEQLSILERSNWDDKWEDIAKQYSLKIGEKFILNINNKKYKKVADVLPYYKDNSFEIKELKDVYQRVVLHHTATNEESGSLTEANYIRDLHSGQRGFNDIGYHFMISRDGKIFEGRPIGRVGAHAGTTREQVRYRNKYFPNGIASLSSLKDDEYNEKLKYFINAQKMDPDYGSLGIALLGNFQGKNISTGEQNKSLINLLNWAKKEFDIPTDNIIYHKEVKEKIVEASGMRLRSSPTVCPGSNFLEKDYLKNNLITDTEYSNQKTMLLEKFNILG